MKFIEINFKPLQNVKKLLGNNTFYTMQWFNSTNHLEPIAGYILLMTFFFFFKLYGRLAKLVAFHTQCVNSDTKRSIT